MGGRLRQLGTFMGRGTRTLWLGWLLLLANFAAVHAQDVTCGFMAPPQPLAAGQLGSLWLYCMNNSSNAVSRAFEPGLHGTITLPDASLIPVQLSLHPPTNGLQVTIAPGSFVRAEYWLDVPGLDDGPFTLSVSNYNQVVVRIEQPRPVATISNPAPLQVDLNKTTPDSVLKDYINSHVFFYEPDYFILGSTPAAEFQISLKYKLLNVQDNWIPYTHLYFAYTQTSFWNVLSRDPAFYDTSYKPSAFVLYPDLLHNNVFNLDLQGGTEHESNGRGGTEERSLYTVYLQPKATFVLPYDFQFSLQPRAWVYYLIGSNNPNLPEYRGNADLTSALTWLNNDSGERIQFSTRLRIGDQGSHAGLLFDLRFNFAGLPILRKFNPSIQVQYFTGYGQTLLQYDEISHALRAGLCLWY
jgi:outer membrane phospholipase A